MKIESVTKGEFDGDVIITATAGDEAIEVLIQTLDGEYRPALDCRMFRVDCNEEIDEDDEKIFDFDELIRVAESFAEKSVSGEENPDYYNKVASPFTRRFLSNEEDD